MPLKRKAASTKGSPPPPPKRTRKTSPTSLASSRSASSVPKTRTGGRTALPTKPLELSKATNTRAAARTTRQTHSSSLAPAPPSSPLIKTTSRTRRVTRSSSSAPAPERDEVEGEGKEKKHGEENDKEGEKMSSSPALDGPPFMPPQPDILSQDIDDLQLGARQYDQHITKLKKGNTQLVVKDKKMGTSLNMLHQQNAADIKQNKADAATINNLQTENMGLKEKVNQLEEVNTTLYAKTTKNKFTDENQPEDSDSHNSDNVSDVSDTKVWQRMDELTTDLSVEKKKNGNLELDLSAEKATVKVLEERFEKDRRELTTVITPLVAKIAELKTKLEEAEETISNGVEELREADEELKEVKEALTTADQEKASAEANLQDAINELKNVDGMAKELVACQEDLRRVNGALEKAKRREKEAKSTAFSKQKDLDSSIAEIRELEEKLDAATLSLEEELQNLKNANEEISKLKEERDEYLRRIESNTMALNESNAELIEKQTALVERSKQIGALEEEVEKQRNLNEHLQEAADGHLKTKRDMEKMVKALTAEVVKMRGRPAPREQMQEGRSGRIGLALDWDKGEE